MSADLHISINNEDDIVAARQRAREAARGLGFGMLDQSRIATAVSELTRNIVRYATDGRGELRLRTLADGPRVGIEIVVSDDGPGIADIELVMRDGFTSGKGLGLGLPGTRRLMDELDIMSEVSRGTTVTIRKWRS
jgi:serine/threonine-protein kinase RsbT